MKRDNDFVMEEMETVSLFDLYNKDLEDDEKNELLYSASRSGNLHFITFLVEEEFYYDKQLGSYLWQNCAQYAAQAGHLDVVKYMIDLGVNNMSFITNSAAEGGNKQVLDYLLVLGVNGDEEDSNRWDSIAYYAARGGHSEIVNRVLELKEEQCNLNLIAAGYARGGHRELLNEMIVGFKSKDGNGWNMIAGDAVVGNQDDIVYDMIDRGANDWDDMACSAALLGNVVLLDYLIKKGANKDRILLYTKMR